MSWHRLLQNCRFPTESCGTFATDRWIVSLWASFWTCSPAPLTRVSVLLPHTCCPYCCGFLVRFTVGNCKCSNLVPLKNCFGCFVSFTFPHTFMVRLLISGPLKSANLLIGIGCVCARPRLTLTGTHQCMPLSMGFPRQEHWSGLPFPSPGDLSNSGLKPRSSPLQADSLPNDLPGKLSAPLYSFYISAATDSCKLT